MAKKKLQFAVLFFDKLGYFEQVVSDTHKLRNLIVMDGDVMFVTDF